MTRILIPDNYQTFSINHFSGCRLISLLLTHLDDELSVIEGDVSDLRPRETNLGSQPVVLLIDVEPKSVDAKPELGSFLVLDLEVVDAIHLEVLGDLEVLHHGVLPQHPPVLAVPVGDPLLPLLSA